MSPAASPVILNVLALNPSKRGIIESQLIATARELRARGWHLACCFSHEPPAWLMDSMREAGLEARWASALAVSGVLRLVREIRPDLVHLHFGVPHPLFHRLRSEGITRIVYTEHSFRGRKPLAVVRALVRHIRTRPVSRFIAVSSYIAGQIRRDYLAGAERIRVVRNGVDIEAFRPADDPAAARREILGLDPSARVIGVASHLHPLKRLDMLISSMPEILRAAPRAHLAIAGRGIDLGRLEGIIASLSLGRSVRILGSDMSVPRLYQASDISVLPSTGEGLPGGAIEAMACGLPLVATPCGGLAEVPEDGKSGILVRDETAHGLATAIIPLLTDEALRMRMGRAARERAVAAFDLRRTVRETIAVYEELLR